MRRHLPAPWALAAALLVAAPVAAQQTNPRVDSIFAEFDSRSSPGCALAVMRGGTIVYERGYGMADLEHDVPNGPEMVFDIGSTAKQFAAMSILLLERDGTLSLDDDVRRLIPELPDYGDIIRIRHLLTHTSGLRDYIGLLTMAGARYDDVTTEADALAAIVRQKALNFRPGTEYLYSNSGYFLLSVLVKRASGVSLRDFARRRIFDPLGMTRTHYLSSYDSIVPGRAIGYAPRDGGGHRQDMPRWLQTGDGGVFTTARELARWDANFYAPLVGDSALLARMQTPVRLTNGSAITYALGLRVDRYRGARTVSHGGSWGGYRAELIRFPEQRFSVATLCNVATADPATLARRVADVYLAGELAQLSTPAPGRTARPTTVRARPAVPLARVTGLYRHTSSGATLSVEAMGDSLFLVLPRRILLESLGGSDFAPVRAFEGDRLTIEPARGARPRVLTWHSDGDPSETFEGIDPARPTPEDLAAYAGAYFSEELQALYTVAAVAGGLELRARNRPSVRLRPSIQHEFTSGQLVLRFTRDPAGTVTRFTMGIGRVRGLEFHRDSRIEIRDSGSRR